MLVFQKIFLIVRFFNWISCNKGLKAKISCFFLCFFCLTHLRLECWRIRKTASFQTFQTWRSRRHIGWRNTKICINGASRFLLVIWVKRKQSVCSIILLYSSTFYSLFLPFFILEIFKFKYDRFFVRHSASISKFKWFEQLCWRGGFKFKFNYFPNHWSMQIVFYLCHKALIFKHFLTLSNSNTYIWSKKRVWVLQFLKYETNTFLGL